MAILAFSLTDIFDTIGTLIGTGEKSWDCCDKWGKPSISEIR